MQKILKRYLDTGEAKLHLSITTLPNPGALGLNLFTSADGIVGLFIETLQAVKGWAPLKWRFERGTSASLAGPASAPFVQQGAENKPQGGMKVPWRFWRAKVVTEHRNGELKSHWCLLQVAADSCFRSIETAMFERRDCDIIAAHAHRFNQHMLREEGVDPMDVDGGGVQVCMPTICQVLQSPLPEFFGRDDAVILLPYKANEVQKFVFDGSEDFLEIPHAFFHYVSWVTGGQECVSDLQGVEEENGTVVLVNPCMPRSIGWGAGACFGSIENGARGTPQLFDRLHPKCGPLCKSFDPDRRAKPTRRHCGVPISCGFQAPSCASANSQRLGQQHTFM